jgi:ADP-heptose:LPS heptosyltransferase
MTGGAPGGELGAVLVARMDHCGDVLLAGPAVRAAAASGRPVHLLCGPRGRTAADMLPGVTSVIEQRVPWIEPDPMPVRERDAAALVRRVRARGISDAAVLVSSHQSPLPLALLLRWAGVGRIAAISHDHAGSLLDIRVPGDPEMHEVRRGLLVTEALGLPSLADDRLDVDLGDGHLNDGARALIPRTGSYVVVHPGASAVARTLAPGQWRDVVRRVAATGRPVVVTGSKEETRLTGFVTGKHPGVLDLGGRLTLPQLGSVLAQAETAVTGNTGPMHLAAAVGTPIVAAFPPTVPVGRWRPWRVPHVILGDQTVPCAGCRSRTCPLHDQVCVSSIDGDAVVRALDELASLDIVRSVP